MSIRFLIVTLVLSASCSTPDHNKRFMASDGSFSKLPAFHCEGGTLYEDDTVKEVFSGAGECGMYEEGLNSGNRYYCVGAKLFEGLQEKEEYAGWAICDGFVKDLNSEKRYRCQDGSLYEGLSKVKTFGGGNTQCLYELRELNN